MMTRGLPPYGYGTSAPCTTASAGRMMFCPRSLSFVSGSELLERLSWMIGTSVAP